jgi:hypothetical protein
MLRSFAPARRRRRDESSVRSLMERALVLAEFEAVGLEPHDV